MDFLITRQELLVLTRKIGCISERRAQSERNRREEQCCKFMYLHFLVLVELRLLMKRQRRTRPRGAGATQQRRARKEQTRAKTLRTERERECSAAKQIPRTNQQRAARYQARAVKVAFQSRKLIRPQPNPDLKEKFCSRP